MDESAEYAQQEDSWDERKVFTKKGQNRVPNDIMNSVVRLGGGTKETDESTEPRTNPEKRGLKRGRSIQ